VQEVTERPVASHRRCVAEHHLADIDGDVLVRVNVFNKLRNLGAERFLSVFVATVAVKLNVREMAASSFERLHRFERRRPVARHP